MIYIVLDTNIWLYLANGYDLQKSSREQNLHSNSHIALFDSLDLFASTGQIEILINDQIIAEWERNELAQLELISDLNRKKIDLKKSLKNMRGFLPDVRRPELDGILSAMFAEIDSRIEQNKQHIRNVESFLHQKCTHIPISKKTNERVLKAALDKKKAPFVTNKNNLADAIILYSVIDYLEEGNSPSSGISIFISNNYKDFADTSGVSFHPDIKELIGGCDLRYERNLPLALDFSSEIRADLELYFESIGNEWDGEESEDFFVCEWCSYYETNHGHFSILMTLVKGPDDFHDPNQLWLFDHPKSPPTIVKAGECHTCYTLSVVCPNCENLISDPEEEYVLFCETCQKSFSYKERLPDGLVIWEIETTILE